jgi:phospholipid/cholesterol/gamma-HCH transport system permease protein
MALMDKILEPIHKLGLFGLERLQVLGQAGVFLLASIPWGGPGSAGFKDLVKQIYSIGVRSLSIIIVAGFFVGMVLGLQGYTILSDFGSTSALGTMVSLTLLRELGPVVTALLFAGRAGSALTAEIGLMKATEQLSAMEMMGVDPLKRIITPRLWAGFISMPILALLFSLVGIWGGAYVGINMLGVDEGA